ncbi:MAG: hypothetical protein U1E33_06295 [Rhodospirillales bacterium]
MFLDHLDVGVDAGNGGELAAQLLLHRLREGRRSRGTSCTKMRPLFSAEDDPEMPTIEVRESCGGIGLDDVGGKLRSTIPM